MSPDTKGFCKFIADKWKVITTKVSWSKCFMLF